MSAPDLDAIQARLDAATPGPWEVTNANEGTEYAPMWMITNDAFHSPPADDDEPWLAVELNTGIRADAELIAHAPADLAALLSEVERLTAERDEARAALAALVTWVADEIGYPVQMVMGPPIPAAAWPVLVDHVHADASGNWHGNTLDREDTEAWLADEAGIDLAAVLANHPTTKEARDE